MMSKSEVACLVVFMGVVASVFVGTWYDPSSRSNAIRRAKAGEFATRAPYTVTVYGENGSVVRRFGAAWVQRGFHSWDVIDARTGARVTIDAPVMVEETP